MQILCAVGKASFQQANISRGRVIKKFLIVQEIVQYSCVLSEYALYHGLYVAEMVK